jgi:argininosuccinate lyase
MIINNLPSGYFRDLQMVKEVFLPSFKELNDCLNITGLALENMSVNEGILNDPKYDYLFSVEAVNELVLKGIPFREAYKQVGQQIEAGEFKPEKKVNHVHEGSIGNLCLPEIGQKKNEILKRFNFRKLEESKRKLLESPF